MKGALDQIVATTREMRTVLETARRVAATTVTTLIVGEPGTGKLRLARGIHAASQNGELRVIRGDAFVADEFAANMTSGGTVVFATIDALPPPAQALVLQTLKEKKIGGRSVDVRVLATARRELAGELGMRVSLMRIDVPPLRQRRTDIVPLARQLAGHAKKRLTPELEEMLEAHAWPGNVRELEGVIAAAIEAAGSSAALRAAHLPEKMRSAVAARGDTMVSPALRAQIDALRAEGLLAGMSDAVLARIVADGASSLADLLLAYYARDPARASADRFLVHDASFGQETDDVVAELSALLGSPPLFVQIANEPDVITVRGANGEEEDIQLDAGLDDVVYHFNEALTERGADRRIVRLETGDSRLAYFALPLPAIARLRAARVELS